MAANYVLCMGARSGMSEGKQGKPTAPGAHEVAWREISFVTNNRRNQRRTPFLVYRGMKRVKPALALEGAAKSKNGGNRACHHRAYQALVTFRRHKCGDRD